MCSKERYLGNIKEYNGGRKARKAWWGKEAAPKFSGVVHDFDMDPKAREHFEGQSRKERNVSRCATKRQERRAREAKMQKQASSKSKKSSKDDDDVAVTAGAAASASTSSRVTWGSCKCLGSLIHRPWVRCCENYRACERESERE